MRILYGFEEKQERQSLAFLPTRRPNDNVVAGTPADSAEREAAGSRIKEYMNLHVTGNAGVEQGADD